MKKLLSVVLVLAVLLSTAAFTALAEEHEVVELIVYQKYASDDRQALMQGILDEAGMDWVHLKFVDSTADVFVQKYSMLMNAGETIDLVMDVGNNNQGYCENATNGWMVPLDSYLEDWEDWNYLSEEDREDIRSSLDGQLYYLPFGKYFKTMFYRTDYLAEAGLEPPTTYEEFLEEAKQLTDVSAGRYGYSWYGNGSYGHFLMYLPSVFETDQLYLHSDGGPDVTGILRDGSSVWDHHDEMVKALQYWKELFTTTPSDATSWGYPQSVESFYSGQTAFLIQDCEVIATCEKYMEEGTWDTCMLPATKDGYMFSTGSPSGGAGCGVSSTTQDVELSVEVLKTLFGREGALKFCNGYGLIPVYSAEGFDMGYYQSYADMAATGKLEFTDNRWLGTLQTQDDLDYQLNLGFDINDLLAGYVTGQLTEDDVINGALQYNAWWREKPEILAIVEAAAE